MLNKIKNMRFFSVVLGAILLLAVLAGGFRFEAIGHLC